MPREELSESAWHCEVNELCSALITRVEKIFAKDKKFTNLEFMELYRHVFEYFYFKEQINKPVRITWSYLTDEETNKIWKNRRFFNKLDEFLRNQVDHILTVGEDEKDDGGVLRFYAREWIEYQRKAKVLNDACCRAYSQFFNGPERHRQVDLIYKLAVTIWRDHPFRTRVVRAVQNLIERERNGNQSPDTHLIKDVINCFAEDARNIYVEDFNCYISWWSFEGDLSVYRDTFESQFLRETEIFYARKRSEFLNSSSSCTEYQNFVEQMLQIEDERVRMYLPERTGEKSMSICRAELQFIKHSDNGSQSEKRVDRKMQEPAVLASTLESLSIQENSRLFYP